MFKNWSRDQRRVVAEALRAYGGLLLLSDVTLPGTPEHERHRRRVALPWADLQRTRVETKALYKANRRFQRRMRWLKRKAYNDARSVLTKAGYEYKSLPPVLVGNLELQRRGALHAHLALPYTTTLEMTFTRAFIDSMKKWAPLCGLGHVQGWRAADRSAVIGHERAIGYMTKYLTGKHPPEVLRTVSGPVVTVSRSLTRKTGVTMQMLRKMRRLWSARQGRCEMPNWSSEEVTAVAQLLDSRHDHARSLTGHDGVALRSRARRRGRSASDVNLARYLMPRGGRLSSLLDPCRAACLAIRQCLQPGPPSVPRDGHGFWT